MTDHDAVFKQLLTEFFVEFLELFCPDVLPLLDRQRVTFLDKESFADLGDPNRREADLVARVGPPGHDAFFIIHLEHQAQEDNRIDRRMFGYFARLYERYDVPIYPILLCSYATPRSPVADQHALQVGELPVLSFRYRTVQLNRLDWRTFVQHPNPLATALMARMAIAPQDRARVKSACLAHLVGLPLSAERRRMLAGFIGVYLRLTSEEEQQVKRDLTALYPQVQETVMELVTEWEIKGQNETRIKMLLRVVERRFGELNDALQAHIAALSIADQEALFDALTDIPPSITTLPELQQWLTAHPPPPPDDVEIA